MNRTPASILAALLLATIGASTRVDEGMAAPSSGARLEMERRTVESTDGRRFQADVGRLMVPENRGRNSRQIPIRFLRLKSTVSSPRAPLFYLAGGPGDRGVSESKGAIDLWSKFLPVCDVVLIDQRGVSDTALRWRWDGPPPVSYFVHVDSALRHYAEVTRRGAAAIRARGVDLAGYTSVESATDLDELRQALGIERVSLFGFSYGSHLACAYLKRFDAHVDDVVLLGLEGPDQTYKLPWTMDTQFQKLALLAARDPGIAATVPDLVALYDRVVAKLARQPMRVPVPIGPGSRDTLQIPVGPFGLRYILRFDIGDATDLPVFPRLLWSIDQGDPSVLAWFVAKRGGGGTMGVSAMSAVMDAASGVTQGRRKLIESQSKTSRFADVVNFPYSVTEAAWGAPDLGDAFRAPVVTKARILLISGTLDFNTPPQQSEEFRWGAPNATHLVVEHAGHEQIFHQNDTSLPVILDFLSGRDVRDRKITYRPLRFVPLHGTDSTVTHPSVTR